MVCSALLFPRLWLTNGDMTLTDAVLAQTVDKDDGGDGGADGVPSLCENVVAILGLDPLDFGGWLGAIGRHVFLLFIYFFLEGVKGVCLLKEERN